MSTVWIVTEFYSPDENATGYLMTSLAKGLCQDTNVHVVCRRPKTPNANELAFQSSKTPEVERVWSTDFSKDHLGRRVVNIATLSVSIFFHLLVRLRPRDEMIVVTNPPTLPYVAIVAAFLRRAVCAVLVYDVYPEVLVATRLIEKKHPLVTIMHGVTSQLFRLADAIIVLGRDMKELVSTNYPSSNGRLRIIPNWAETEEITPTNRNDSTLLNELSLTRKFVIGYIGNIGRTHDIEILAKSALMLSDNPEIHFLFIGNGAKKQWLDEFVLKNRLSNVTVLPFYERKRQSEVHNACDLSIISFIDGMTGLSVPSRMYNMMAAGKPILAVTESWSELARVIQEEQIGWIVSSHDPSDIVQSILTAKSHPEDCREMGKRARNASVQKYSFQRILFHYRELLIELSKGAL